MNARKDGREDGIRERHRWLSQLEKSFAIIKINEFVYNINGKKVLIKFTNPGKNNIYWFDATYNALKEMDTFVWICEKSENYYVIPREKMNELINAKNYFNRRDDCPTFKFEPAYHKYRPANIDVSFYYRNISLLR